MLRAAGYDRVSVYGAPGGFVIVTRIERTDESGEPEADARRWLVEAQAIGMLSRLKSFLFPEPGYFRVLVFTASTEVRLVGEREATRDEAQRWLAGGASTLPPSLREQLSDERLRVAALVYDFEQPAEHQAARQRTPEAGGPRARIHLERAGIWQPLVHAPGN